MNAYKLGYRSREEDGTDARNPYIGNPKHAWLAAEWFRGYEDQRDDAAERAYDDQCERGYERSQERLHELQDRWGVWHR